MIARALVIGGLALGLLTAAEASVPETPSPSTIVLDRPVHFPAADGSDVLVVPGDYQVEAGPTSQLKLIREVSEQKPPLLIEAFTTSYDLEVSSPVVLAIRWQEDEHHVILLLPRRKAFEAVGSSSGVRPRGMAYKPLPPAHVKAALRAKRASSP